MAWRGVNLSPGSETSDRWQGNRRLGVRGVMRVEMRTTPDQGNIQRRTGTDMVKNRKLRD